MLGRGVLPPKLTLWCIFPRNCPFNKNAALHLRQMPRLDTPHAPKVSDPTEASVRLSWERVLGAQGYRVFGTSIVMLKTFSIHCLHHVSSSQMFRQRIWSWLVRCCFPRFWCGNFECWVLKWIEAYLYVWIPNRC